MQDFKFGQEMLGKYVFGAKTNVDLVFVIDATQSMAPILDTVKSFALSFHEKVVDGLKKFNKSVNQLRVKVIAFRDYYCDDKLAMIESEFFYLPEENNQFKEFVSKIEPKGGGDIPESALEALALAMRSDWVTEGTSKRHAIVLFTDAPAHPLEQQKDGIPSNYPNNMFQNFNELAEAWGVGQGTCMDSNEVFKMDKNARRLILFAPDVEPWDEVQKYFEQCFLTEIGLDKGGEELDIDIVINTISKSIK